MRYFFIDKTEHLIKRFTAVQYATATVALFAIVAGVSAFFYSWLAVVSAAAIFAVFFHIGFVCFLGPLLGLNNQTLGCEEVRTRILAFVSSVSTVLAWWLIVVAQSQLLSVNVEVWIQVIAGALVYVWGLTFVVWAARKHSTWFDLIPKPLFKRW